MIRYWSSEPAIRNMADDTRTLSLHVLSRAGFGKSFPFQRYQGQQTISTAFNSDLATTTRRLSNWYLITAS